MELVILNLVLCQNNKRINLLIMNVLYITATPIGNLEDITLRALRILVEVDAVLCEDTRVTKRLLDHHGIETKTISYHQHSKISKVDHILSLLKDGKSLALVSDSGTPGISDPGGKLVKEVYEKMGDEVSIEVVPGPSAVTAALSVSGMPTDSFAFLGFPPHKKGRNKFIKNILTYDFPVVVYESKYRIVKFLKKLNSLAEENKATVELVIARELSKMHETVYRGEAGEILENIEKENEKALKEKGEFVIIVRRVKGEG